MNHTEKYSDKELRDLQEACKCLGFTKHIPKSLHSICTIALVEINRVLNERASRKDE